MKLVRSIKNQYLGINAHLHSRLQNDGGWSDFHARHIIHIADTLKAHLRSMGYTVGIEESLQIKRLHGQTHEPESDILIYDTEPQRRPEAEAAIMENPTTIAELLAEEPLSEQPFRSVVIRRAIPTQAGRGEPVAWIELLSPSNKGGSDDARFYRFKRLEILAAGLVFVEIDYLHETQPTFPSVQAYRVPRRRMTNQSARPYHIAVLDPRKKYEKGPAWVKSFSVDQAIPPIVIPLSGADTLEFDFGVPYRKTFEEGFLGDDVNYAEFPVQFDHYHPTDQTRIAARMLAVLEAAQKEIDLEAGPFPIKDVDLDSALKQIQLLQMA